jgi:hypothetical protein
VDAPPNRNYTGSTSEWILERPKISGGYGPLADYSQLDISGMTAITSAGQTINGLKGQLVKMLDDANSDLSLAQFDADSMQLIFV